VRRFTTFLFPVRNRDIDIRVSVTCGPVLALAGSRLLVMVLDDSWTGRPWSEKIRSESGLIDIAIFFNALLVSAYLAVIFRHGVRANEHQARDLQRLQTIQCDRGSRRAGRGRYFDRYSPRI